MEAPSRSSTTTCSRWPPARAARLLPGRRRWATPPAHIAAFYRAFPPARAARRHLSLFARDGRDPRDHLLAQDVIYVGGGNTVNMLAVWRAHGVDAALREAWEAGVVLCGMSAGSLCWFEAGVTDSYGPAAAAARRARPAPRQPLPPLRRRGRAPADLPPRGRRGPPGRDRRRRLLRPALRRHRARRGGRLAAGRARLPGRAGAATAPSRRRSPARYPGRMSRRVAASLAVAGGGQPGRAAPARPRPQVQIAALAIVSFPLATLVIAALAPARSSAPRLLIVAAGAVAATAR